jgi:uncharacterized cupredoxin-like copper-binding protein
MRAIVVAVGLVVLAMGVAEATPQRGVYVTMAANVDHAERAAHVDAIKRGLANHSALENRNFDVNVGKLSVTIVGNEVEIVAELSFVLSTAGDRIVSVGSQTAKLRVARRQFHASKLPALRREVIENALVDLRRKLRAHAARTV